MPIVNCKICKKKFYAKPHWLKMGWGKYCSATCQHKAQLRGKFVNCSICGKKVWKAPKALSHSKSGKYFCGKSCQTLWRNQTYVGEKHPNWKGGRFVYKSIIKRSKKKKICVLCRTKDIRILAVHHLDKNKCNSKLENLVWLCHNCHFLVHHYPEIRRKLMGIVV